MNAADYDKEYPFVAEGIDELFPHGAVMLPNGKLKRLPPRSTTIQEFLDELIREIVKQFPNKERQITVSDLGRIYSVSSAVAAAYYKDLPQTLSAKDCELENR
jgi:hypothetical protein